MVVQSEGWVSAMVSFYDLSDVSLEKDKVRGLVPCCGQDGYRAQVSQRPIDTNHTVR